MGSAQSTAILRNCSNDGVISVSRENLTEVITTAGGIAGCLSHNTIVDRCFNTNTVSGGNCSGGIVGLISNNLTSTHIINSYNTGIVEQAISNVGGICGYLYESNSNIINCYNKGSISSKRFACGIMGLSITRGTANIINCYNTGELASELADSVFRNCTWGC